MALNLNNSLAFLSIVSEIELDGNGTQCGMHNFLLNAFYKLKMEDVLNFFPASFISSYHIIATSSVPTVVLGLLRYTTP